MAIVSSDQLAALARAQQNGSTVRNVLDLDAELADARRDLAQAEGQEAFWHDRASVCRGRTTLLEKLIGERDQGSAAAEAVVRMFDGGSGG